MFIVSGLYSRIKILPLHPSTSPVWSLCNRTNREVAQLSNWSWWGASKHQHCNSECAKWHDIYTPADEWMQNNADFKWLCHEWFHHVPEGHSIGQLTTISWRLDSFTVSFHGDARGESGLRELASFNRRTQLGNGHVADLEIMPGWLQKNGVT